jgi:hypothetical protein
MQDVTARSDTICVLKEAKIAIAKNEYIDYSICNAVPWWQSIKTNHTATQLICSEGKLVIIVKASEAEVRCL